MKRHDRLQDLSREHHAALRLALQARRAAASGDHALIDSAAAAVIVAFHTELDPHFVIEEQTLLPLLTQPGEGEVVTRIEHEHAELRRLSALLQEPDAATLAAFGELLNAHVRFEEREMFPLLEACFLR
jgi:hemerythrin-like domain-containing protein